MKNFLHLLLLGSSFSTYGCYAMGNPDEQQDNKLSSMNFEEINRPQSPSSMDLRGLSGSINNLDDQDTSSATLKQMEGETPHPSTSTELSKQPPELPPEIRQYIYSYLNPFSLGQLALVSAQENKLSQDMRNSSREIAHLKMEKLESKETREKLEKFPNLKFTFKLTSLNEVKVFERLKLDRSRFDLRVRDSFKVFGKFKEELLRNCTDIATRSHLTLLFTSLDLSSNNLKAEDARPVAQLVQASKKIQFLDLAQNRWGVEGLKLILKALETNTTLQSLNLRDTNLPLDNIDILSDFLKLRPSITSVNLGVNPITSKSSITIAAFIRNTPTLNTLNLDGIKLQNEGWSVLVEALYDSSLQSLSLENNEIGPEDIGLFSELLKKNRVLRCLRLGQNNIGDVGAAALAEGLESNASLRELELPDNKINLHGIEALANSLKVNTTLTLLNLHANMVRDKGAAAFAQALEVNSSLIHLILSLGEIGDKGAIALAQRLRNNHKLRYLILSYNCITGYEEYDKVILINELVLLLNKNTTIQRLDFASADNKPLNEFQKNYFINKIVWCEPDTASFIKSKSPFNL